MLYPIIRRVRRPLLPPDPVPNPVPVAPVPALVELPLKEESSAEAVTELPAQTVETAPLAASPEVPEPLPPVVVEAFPLVTEQPATPQGSVEPVPEQAPLIAESAPLEVTATAKPKRTNNGRKAKTEAA